MEKIIRAMEKCGVSTWRLTREHTQAVELYYIRKQLDIPRVRELSLVRAEVFRDFEEDGNKFRGSAEIFIEPGMTDDEIAGRIRDAYYAASFVKNPFYELPAPTADGEVLRAGEGFGEMTPAAVAAAAGEVLLSGSGDDTAFINSAEIFASRRRVQIRDSKGTNVSYDADSLSGEFVAQCISPEDVEQFRQFSYQEADLASLREKLEEGIRDVRLRSQAAAAPKTGKYDIILTAENLREILGFYLQRSSSAMIYPQYSTWKTGDNVQGEMGGGERLNLTLQPTFPCSSEGIPLRPRPLLEDGKLCTIHGNSRNAYYLGIEPTGEYEKLSLDAGTLSLEEMRRPGTLEAVSFSDFQMDAMDGHFAGELRLGLLTGEDGKRVPLTGGSINGSLLDAQGKLIFSKERYRDSAYEGPLAVLIPGVTVAGE